MSRLKETAAARKRGPPQKLPPTVALERPTTMIKIGALLADGSARPQTPTGNDEVARYASVERR